MAAAETDHMPIYLRVFLRLLSSWVHRGVFADLRGVIEGSPPTRFSSHPPVRGRAWSLDHDGRKRREVETPA